MDTKLKTLDGRVLALALVGILVQPVAAWGDSAKPVETGVVIRGVELPKTENKEKGKSTGYPCNFSNEAVDERGRMVGASVNCRPGSVESATIKGLPKHFNAYCIKQAPVRGGRLIEDTTPKNSNHCDLSGITREDATKQFGNAVWRW